MNGSSERLQQILASVRDPNSSFDWPLAVLVIAFLLALPVQGLGSWLQMPGLMSLFAPDRMAAYEQSLAAAVLKQPDHLKKLGIIGEDEPRVKVVTFRARRDLKLENRTFDMWVSRSAELRQACLGAANPVRKLQQVLGLPPTPAQNHVVTEIEVDRADLFRPCFGKSSLDSPVCEFGMPARPDKDSDAGTVRKAYDQLRFVSEHMWNTQWVAARDPKAPYAGYPFTGMGWTYDWSARSPNHFGVTEFVVNRAPKITIVSEKSPAEFCGSKTKPGKRRALGS